MVNKFNNKFLRLVKSVLIFFIILLLWKITNYLGIWSDYILPSPEKVYSTFLNMISDGSIFINVYASMKRVLIGFAISTAIGIPLGIFFGIYSGVYEYFKSLINFL
ncbi:TPA: ABC transporter permease, partial [Clostridioides difficile]|nr:ABC transporter permease [Clostridioides difficile]